MKPLLPLLAVALMAAGCASPAAEPTKSAAAARCTREMPTGSSIPTVRCRSAEALEREKEAAMAAGDAIGRSTSGIRGPSGQ